jgi:hypothetical protein
MYFSKIQIEIKNLKISTEAKYKVNHNYEIKIKFYILSKIKLINLVITKTKLEKLNIKEKIKKINILTIKNKNLINKNTLNEFKKLETNLEYLNLKIELGTENAILTSFTTATIASVLGILLKNKINNISKQNYLVQPIYINKNLLKLELNCIITVNLRNIIYIMFVINKKRRSDKNGRTSNRRSYDYSYE